MNASRQYEYHRPILSPSPVLTHAVPGIDAGVEEVSCHLCHYPLTILSILSISHQTNDISGNFAAEKRTYEGLQAKQKFSNHT